MRFAIILAAATALAGAQQTAKEITVPSSPAEIALEKTAEDIRANRRAVGDGLQQARWELDKENKPLQAEIERLEKRIGDLQARIAQNHARAQDKFNELAKSKQKQALIDQAQIPWLEKQVRESAKLPENAQFDVDTGKWTLQR